ncbi:MAG: GTP cyclohydrolase II [Sumerlaeia bacterium]
MKTTTRPALKVRELTRARIPTTDGTFHLCFFENTWDDKEHMAIVAGDVQGGEDVLCRIHSECFTGDVLGSLRCDCGEQLQRSMELIAREGRGVILYLRQEGRGIGLLEKLKAYNLQDEGLDTVDANLALGHGADERDYSIGAHMLRELGVRSIRLLTNNPAKIEGLRGYGIPVTRRVPLTPQVVTSDNAHYLATKVQRMRHLLNLGPARGPFAPQNSDEQNLLDRAPAFARTTGRPFVTLSYAQSIDGCIAARRGKPLALSGPESLEMTHQLRADHDAILIGVGTVIADDPSLTVRHVAGENPQPIILDSHLRTPADCGLLTDPARQPWIFCTPQADAERREALESAGARILEVPADAHGHVDLAAAMDRLGDEGITSVMVEGGAQVITSFLTARLVDHVVLTITSMLVGGGVHAVGSLSGGNGSKGSSFPRLANKRVRYLGEDLILQGDPVWEEDGPTTAAKKPEEAPLNGHHKGTNGHRHGETA